MSLQEAIAKFLLTQLNFLLFKPSNIRQQRVSGWWKTHFWRMTTILSPCYVLTIYRKIFSASH